MKFFLDSISNLTFQIQKTTKKLNGAFARTLDGWCPCRLGTLPYPRFMPAEKSKILVMLLRLSDLLKVFTLLERWISPHRLENIEQMLWRPDFNKNSGIYRCINRYPLDFFNRH